MNFVFRLGLIFKIPHYIYALFPNLKFLVQSILVRFEYETLEQYGKFPEFFMLYENNPILKKYTLKNLGKGRA